MEEDGRGVEEDGRGVEEDERGVEEDGRGVKEEREMGKGEKAGTGEGGKGEYDGKGEGGGKSKRGEAGMKRGKRWEEKEAERGYSGNRKRRDESLPWRDAVDDDITRVGGREDGHLLYHEDLDELAYVVPIPHICFRFVVERREDLAFRHIPLLELGDLVQLGSGDGEVGLRVEFGGCLVQFRMQEKPQQEERDHVRGHGFFVAFCYAEGARADACVAQ